MKITKLEVTELEFKSMKSGSRLSILLFIILCCFLLMPIKVNLFFFMLRYIRKKITRYGKTEKNEWAERA